MAWMNRHALEQTISTGEVHYWSRSREKLWHKGATSGNIQILKGIRSDCDSDVLLLSVEQKGKGACHTGTRSCFFEAIRPNDWSGPVPLEPPSDASSELFKVIEHRRSNPEENSYTNKLLKGGDNLILKKIGEESAEFVMACKDNDYTSITNEAADMIYHLQVAIAHHEVQWSDVLEVLAKRRGAPRRS